MPTLVKMTDKDEVEHEQLSDTSQKRQPQSDGSDDSDKDIVGSDIGDDGIKEHEQLSDASQKPKSRPDGSNESDKDIVGRDIDRDAGEKHEQLTDASQKPKPQPDGSLSKPVKDDACTNNKGNDNDDMDIDEQQNDANQMRKSHMDDSNVDSNNEKKALSADNIAHAHGQTVTSETNATTQPNASTVSTTNVDSSSKSPQSASIQLQPKESTIKEDEKSTNNNEKPTLDQNLNDSVDSSLAFTSSQHNLNDEDDDDVSYEIVQANSNIDDAKDTPGNDDTTQSDAGSHASTQSSIHNEEDCGHCKKLVNDCTFNPYKIKCVCCAQQSYIHKSCVEAVLEYNKPDDIKMTKNISSTHFNKASFPIFCNKCQQDCFWCGEMHESKFMSFLVFEFGHNDCTNEKILYTSDSKQRRVCGVCNMHWCFVSSEEHDDESMLECQLIMNKAVCHTCKYKNKSVPSTLYIGAKGLASAGKTLSSPMSSPEKDQSAASSKKRRTSESSLDEKAKPPKKKKPTQPGLKPESTGFEIKRYELNNNRASKILHKIPQNKKKQVIALIRHHLGLKIPSSEKTNPESAKAKEPFLSMDEAEEYFFRKFLIFNDESKYGSLFQVKYPSSIEEYQRVVSKAAANDIDLRLKDLRSVLGTTWLNDNIIKFILKSLNYVKLNQEKNKDPPILFGVPLDKNPVVIDQNNFRNIHQHVKFSNRSELKFEDSEQLCIAAMKHWYSQHNKNYLNYILDRYSKGSNGRMIAKYANVLNISGAHWFLLVVTLKDGDPKFEPNVYTIDNYITDDVDTVKIRRWFAKFFGLYYKQHNNPDGFVEEDFNCHELIQERHGQIEFRSERPLQEQSHLKHVAKERTFKQIDEWNCGILSIIQCIELFNEEETFHLLGREEHKTYLINFRLRILSLIRDLYDLLNGKLYDPYQDHLMMKEGNWKNTNHVQSFLFAHLLFEEGQFKYEKSGKTTSNSISKSTKHDVLKAMHREHVLKLPPATSSTSSNAKSPTKKQRTSKKIESVFYDNDDDVQMQTMDIRDINHARGKKSVMDINNVKLFFDPEKMNPGDETHPRDIVEMLVTFFIMVTLVQMKVKMKKISL